MAPYESRYSSASDPTWASSTIRTSSFTPLRTHKRGFRFHTYAVPMLVFCPRCGAEYPEMAGSYGETNNQCRDCGLAVAEEPPILEPDDDQVAFVLDDWPVEFRGEATAVLVDNGVP